MSGEDIIGTKPRMKDKDIDGLISQAQDRARRFTSSGEHKSDVHSPAAPPSMSDSTRVFGQRATDRDRYFVHGIAMGLMMVTTAMRNTTRMWKSMMVTTSNLVAVRVPEALVGSPMVGVSKTNTSVYPRQLHEASP
ncbi:MAG: hypothetical protein Q9168_004788 [Polycauliona sp. 1 TL-2023]